MFSALKADPVMFFFSRNSSTCQRYLVIDKSFVPLGSASHSVSKKDAEVCVNCKLFGILTQAYY